MSQEASEKDVCQAVLDFVSGGRYPESENVIASEFPTSALSKELELISKARDQVEVNPPEYQGPHYFRPNAPPSRLGTDASIRNRRR